jgi:UDPglucose 6-dehydrogenase
MKVSVIALGYVGLTNAVVLAERGFDVLAYDKDAEKVAQLQKGEPAIDEPGLKEALYKYRKRLHFTSTEADIYNGSSVFFVAVDTPTKEDGQSDLAHLNEAVDSILKNAVGETFIVVRSTVPVGTNKRLSETKTTLKGEKAHFIANPEFLAEGQALLDERQPSRIVIGTLEQSARDLLRKIYAKPIYDGVPYYEMDGASAEFTKYASNIFLSMKISYINELSRLAEPLGADIGAVALAMGADPRIGHSMLKAGVGYGGACLPKDGSALLSSAKEIGVRLSLVEDVNAINQSQPSYFYNKIKAKFGSLDKKSIAILGLAFKAKTSDVRRSAASFFVESLLKDGAIVSAYDPSIKAREGFKSLLGARDNLSIVSSVNDAVRGADAILILTEDQEFATLDETALIKTMKGRVIFDGRNLYNVRHFRYFDYISIGRAEHKHE